MKNYKLIALALLSFLVLAPALALAHQPRTVDGRVTFVSDPETSKAYYGHLAGEPDIYIIDSSKPFNLYINILVPAIEGQKKDVSAVILKEGKQIVVLNGIDFEWKEFYEEFGADSYWVGPEYETKAIAGRYEIRVWSSNNDSKYALAVGKKEVFDTKEGINALTLIPKLKKNFFNESPIGFIKSPFGYGIIIVMYFLAFLAGLTYRFILKWVATGSSHDAHHNIGLIDRLLRLALGLALLLWAMTTNWSLPLIFFSGFAVFEAVFSWCGLYAAMGKSTCPME